MVKPLMKGWSPLPIFSISILYRAHSASTVAVYRIPIKHTYSLIKIWDYLSNSLSLNYYFHPRTKLTKFCPLLYMNCQLSPTQGFCHFHRLFNLLIVILKIRQEF